jgi:hypothetical protein
MGRVRFRRPVQPAAQREGMGGRGDRARVSGPCVTPCENDARGAIGHPHVFSDTVQMEH